MQVAHRHAAAADCVVEQETELCDRNAGLERECRIDTPQRVPDPYLPAVDERLGVVPLARPADDQHEPAELGVGVGGRAVGSERQKPWHVLAAAQMGQ